MAVSTSSLQSLRSRPTLRAAWLWVFMTVLLLKAAVPWLASLASHSAGTSVGEICSVYGVRVVAAPQGEHLPADPQHARSEHCPLSPALGTALPAFDRLPAVMLHAPFQRFLAPLSALEVSRDPSLTWLTQRLHAPPVAA